MNSISLQFDNTLLLEKDTVLFLARVFRSEFGKKIVDFGAAEPLIWKSGGECINDLVKALVDDGFTVAITSNGSLLKDFIEDLTSAGLSKLRISWHSFSKGAFEKITGQQYESFLEGISMALESGIDVKFNRLLLKGYTEDIPDHLAWISERQSSIKLYDLYWTPAISKNYTYYYQNVKDIVEDYVKPLTRKIEKIPHPTRSRLRYWMNDRAYVETKQSPIQEHQICPSCKFLTKCREGFLDYLRIGPDGIITPCYLRKDLGINLWDSKTILPELCSQWKIKPEALSSSKLCLTVTTKCNQNCRFPDTDTSWCLRSDSENSTHAQQ